jgi:hypothetical protein
MHITEYGRRLYLKVSGLAEFMCHNVWTSGGHLWT